MRRLHALTLATVLAAVTGGGVASAAPLAIAPSYPQRLGGRAPARGIDRDECTSTIEKWRFAFVVPPVAFTELQVFARKTPGSCLDPVERGPTGACHRVARFARLDVDAGPVDIPSAAMITAGELGVDVGDPATGGLDRDKACFPDGDRDAAPLTLTMILFQDATVVGGVGEATYATTYDLAAPEPPPDFAVTADGPTVHATWTALSSTAKVSSIHAFCFDLDAAGDAGDPPCEIPPGFVTHAKFVAPGFDGFVCASSAKGSSALDIAGLIPGHHYVFSIAVVDDADNTGALSAPACARLAALPPVGSDAGPPPLPPVNGCGCRAVSRDAEGPWWSTAVAVLSMLLMRRRRR